MSLSEVRVTLKELEEAIKRFIENQCEKCSGHLVHKDCGGAIRIGFLNLFYVNRDGSLDPGSDGFGIGPRRVPYCERCFPPDGFNHTFAVRFPIVKDSEGKRSGQKLTWGNRELYPSSQALLTP